MFIEHLDLLRCVRPHEDTWLVASFSAVSNRFVEEAKLGCPSCSAAYWIRGGVADFSGGAILPACEAERGHSSHRREELATRAGAYLDVTEPGGTVVLGGLWAYAAQELSEMTETRVVAINAPSEVKESETVALVRVAQDIPLAPDSVVGVALDAWFPAAIVESAIKVVRPGGRIVGPTSFAALQALTVLAHDARYLVGEKMPDVISLRRAKRGD
jgi:hypothetical protein